MCDNSPLQMLTCL